MVELFSPPDSRSAELKIDNEPTPPAEASEQAAWLAKRRFEEGAADFLTMLDAERTLLEAQDRLARSKTDTATALVALYKALGGGWETVDYGAQTEQNAS